MVHINGIHYEVAFLEGNRKLNPNNVKAQMESLKKFGTNFNALTYIKGDAAKGKNIVDVETGEEVPKEKRSSYIVVLDGQHRYKAALELSKSKQFDLSNLKWTEAVIPEGSTIEDVLIEINTVGQKWKGTDYITGYNLRNPDEPVGTFARELANYGLSGKTINKYLFFCDKFNWGKEDNLVTDKANLERAKDIWEVVSTFPDKVKKQSYIIDKIISEGSWRETLNRVRDITDDDKLKLGKIKNLKELKAATLELLEEN